jgi:hypothetical protein
MKSPGAQAYIQLAKEMIKREKALSASDERDSSAGDQSHIQSDNGEDE